MNLTTGDFNRYKKGYRNPHTNEGSPRPATVIQNKTIYSKNKKIAL